MSKEHDSTAITVPPVTTNLYVKYSSDTYTTREANADDEWDRGNTASNYDLEYISLAAESAYSTVTYPGEVKVGEKIYLLYAVYSTGDSFGHDKDACIELISVHKNLDIARFNYETIKNNTDESYGVQIELSQDNGQTWKMSPPWNGYLESLSYLKIAGFTVRGSDFSGSNGDWYEDIN